jgi:hypothetical protein
VRNFVRMQLLIASPPSAASAVRAGLVLLVTAGAGLAACSTGARDGQHDARNATLPAADAASPGEPVSPDAMKDDGGIVSVDVSTGCEVDDDCVRVEKGCCNLGKYIAVTKAKVASYQAGLHCERVSCPMIVIPDDHSVAQCNAETHACEIVLPGDVACDGSVRNPHECPKGWRCQRQGSSADAPGRCVEACGGIAGFQCSSPNATCVDDPGDGCDPKSGGADCGGVCVTPAE